MLCGKIKFRELRMYDTAHALALESYKLVSLLPAIEHDNLASQIRRAACSLSLNIAEGTGCISYRSFLSFLVFAYRSALELDAALRICIDLKYFPNNEHLNFIDHLDKFTRQLYKYMECIDRTAETRRTARNASYYQQMKVNIDDDQQRRNQGNT
jgi:four helix bundle protein